MYMAQGLQAYCLIKYSILLPKNIIKEDIKYDAYCLLSKIQLNMSIMHEIRGLFFLKMKKQLVQPGFAWNTHIVEILERYTKLSALFKRE